MGTSLFTSSTANWWCRSANYSNANNFCNVNTNGNANNNNSRNSYGLAPIYLMSHFEKTFRKGEVFSRRKSKRLADVMARTLLAWRGMALTRVSCVGD